MSQRRSEENWEIHDRIIDEIKISLERQGKYVVTNPGGEKNHFGAVHRNGVAVFPDLVVRPSKDEDVTELIEVETEDTIDSEEVDQWEMYNAGASDFYLVVPEYSVPEALRLIRGREFSIAGLGWYDTSLNIRLPEGI